METTVNTARKYGAKDITFLYCVSNYPPSIKDFNSKNINILKDKFKCRVGISNHSRDNRAVITAIASKAEVIENILP
jgi:sialic acid synthase SpsE